MILSEIIPLYALACTNIGTQPYHDAIELVITDVLRQVMERAGISNNTLKQFEGEVGISYKINIELPLVRAEPSRPPAHS